MPAKAGTHAWEWQSWGAWFLAFTRLAATAGTPMQIQKSVGRSTKVDWALTADRRHTAALICRALEASKSEKLMS
jgi:hypothetical protein